MNFAPVLSELERDDLVHRLAEFDPAYLFKHILTQESAYQSLLIRRRREIHLLVAQTYERFYPDRLNEDAALPIPDSHQLATTEDRRGQWHYSLGAPL